MQKSSVLIFAILCFALFFNTNFCSGQIFVSTNTNGLNDGSSWQNAFTSLQDAIDKAEENDQIWISKGTYLPGKNGDPKSNTFSVAKGIQFYGGFEGTELTLGERVPAQHPTILSGDLNQNDIKDDFENNRSDNVSTIMLIKNKTATYPTIDGFTFTGGHASEDENDNEHSQGGGLLLLSSAIVRNCIFSQNHAGTAGGAIYFEDSIVYENTSTLIIDSC